MLMLITIACFHCSFHFPQNLPCKVLGGAFMSAVVAEVFPTCQILTGGPHLRCQSAPPILHGEPVVRELLHSAILVHHAQASHAGLNRLPDPAVIPVVLLHCGPGATLADIIKSHATKVTLLGKQRLQAHHVKVQK